MARGTSSRLATSTTDIDKLKDDGYDDHPVAADPKPFGRQLIVVLSRVLSVECSLHHVVVGSLRRLLVGTTFLHSGLKYYPYGHSLMGHRRSF